MRNLIIISLFLSSTKIYANCELLSAGFHTIATYLDKDTFVQSLKYPVDYQLINGNIQIKIDQINSSLENFIVKKIDFDHKQCDSANARLEFPFRMDIPVMEIPLCIPDFTLAKEKPVVKALYDTKDKKIQLPRLASLIKAESIPKEKLDSIEMTIKDYLKNKLFRATIGYDLNPEEYRITSFEHYNYDKTPTILTSVKADSINKITNQAYRFEIIFMSLNNHSWYIADSSFIHPCTRDSVSGQAAYKHLLEYYKENPEANPDFPPPASAQDMASIKSMGVQLFKYGWVYGNEDYPQIIEFDIDYVRNSYFIEFNKSMIVLHESTYREIMTNNPTLGVQPMNEDIKK